MLTRLQALARLAQIKVWREREEVRRAGLTFLAGFAILLLMQMPQIEQSFLGDLDRNMLDTAFKMRTDVISGRADPVLFLDIDDVTLSGAPSPERLVTAAPSATTPRKLLAGLLGYVAGAPPQERPKVVIMDADIGVPTPGDEDGVAQLRTLLAAWAADPGAPPLLIAREAFPPASVGASGEVKILPVTAYDDIVGKAPNIFWASVKMTADQNGVVRDFMPFECARTGNAVQPLYSAVLLAYGFLQNGQLKEGTNARDWVMQAPQWCASKPQVPISHGERINYHLSLEKVGFETRAWPDLPKTWPGFATCGGGDTALFRRLSGADVLGAGPDASRAPLCGRIVIIGGTNTAAADFRQTPLNEMAGPAIIANALRGLQMSGGGLKQIGFPIQVLVLFVVSMLISLSFAASRHARERFAAVKGRRKSISGAEFVQLIVLNPVVLNWSLAFAAHLLGVALLLFSLDHSFWGFLSAPALGAAIMETIQEFSDD